MIKTIIKSGLVVFALLFFVNAYASVEDTHVTLTNNTDKPITIHTNLMTLDQHFKKGSDWDEVSDTLEPYETKQVLWFTRHLDLKSGVNYQYDLTVGHDANRADDFIFRFDVTGSHYYGSTMINAMQLPAGNMQPVLQEKGLEHHAGHFWNGDYVIHARRWKPLTNLFTNVQVVIDKTDNAIIPPEKNNTLRVLTYNTQLQPFYGRVVNDLNQPEERVKVIVPAISAYDVVIFQELFDHDLRGKLTEDMSKTYPYHTRVVGDTTSKAWTGGVMIFSKWPIEKEDQIVYQATTGSDSYAAKGAAYARIDKGGMHYHVFGTHLEANKSTDDVRVRRKQLTELENFIDRMNISRTEPVLVGGDMNIDEFSMEVDTLHEFLNAAKIHNIGYQYSTDALVNTMDVGVDRERLDYVLYDKRHLVPKTSYNKVFVMRALYDEKMWPKFDLSDHFPVESYFEF